MKDRPMNVLNWYWRLTTLPKKFAVDGGKFLTACNDINLRAYKGRTLGISR